MNLGSDQWSNFQMQLKKINYNMTMLLIKEHLRLTEQILPQQFKHTIFNLKKIFKGADKPVIGVVDGYAKF